MTEIAVTASTDNHPDETPMRVGDVVSFEEPSPTVPRELLRKYFRVEAAEGEKGEVQAYRLSMPYVDADCTIRYHAKRPKR